MHKKRFKLGIERLVGKSHLKFVLKIRYRTDSLYHDLYVNLTQKIN